MRRLVAAGAALVVLGAGGAAALRARSPKARAAEVPGKVTATANVTRTDLVVTEDVAGTVGYAGSYAVSNRLAGTLTYVAADGAVVRRGGTLYAVDAVPVRLLYGTVPAYRTLAAGVTGADVKQLEANLAALGHFSGVAPDEKYDARTSGAVRAWQKAAGETATGRVELGRVVFAPGELRVTKAESAVGAPVVPGPLLTATGTTRVVRMAMPVADAALARKGAKVSVEPSSGRALTGTVTSVGTVAQVAEGQDSEPTVEVLVTLPASAKALDGSPVTVRLESESRRGVLAVPVEALLALREGGYAVEVVADGATKLVAVETGLFADGLVEVTGGGLAEGTAVAVPAS